MKKVTSAVHLVASVRVANVWLLEDGGRRFVVDSSHPVERNTLKRALWRAGIRGPGDLAGIILTHRHSDHAGNAYWLRQTFSAPVFCHRDDAPFLAGTCRPPRMFSHHNSFYARTLARFEDALPARCPVDDVFEAGRWNFGFQAIAVPGHTEGSCMLYHEPSSTLFSGDAILAGLAPLRAFEYIRLAVPDFSQDAARCHAHTLRFLAELPRTQTLCSGHGPAINQDVEQKLRRLAASHPTPAPA